MEESIYVEKRLLRKVDFLPIVVGGSLQSKNGFFWR